MRRLRPWGLVTALRGLRSRSAVSVLIFAVAVLAVAGAAAGPAYYGAGQTSVLRDTVASANVLGRGYEITESGPVSASFYPVSAVVTADLGSAARLFSRHLPYSFLRTRSVISAGSNVCSASCATSRTPRSGSSWWT